MGYVFMILSSITFLLLTFLCFFIDVHVYNLVGLIFSSKFTLINILNKKIIYFKIKCGFTTKLLSNVLSVYYFYLLTKICDLQKENLLKKFVSHLYIKE